MTFKQVNNHTYEISKDVTPKHIYNKVISPISGDIIFVSVNAFPIQMKLGQIIKYYAESSPCKRKLAKIIKYKYNPEHKKWYQFWIKQELVGYYIEIL